MCIFYLIYQVEEKFPSVQPGRLSEAKQDLYLFAADPHVKWG